VVVRNHAIVPSIFAKIPALLCAVSTRNGGVSPSPYGMNMSFNVGDDRENVLKNRERFFGGLGIRNDQLAIPQQRHTGTVRVVTSGGTYENCDALITDNRGVFLSVSVADCAPIFLVDPARQTIACIHAGWRGTQQRIVENAVEAMKAQFKSEPGNIVAFIGPAAGSCCYEVGREVAEMFDAEVVERRDGKLYLDIKKANKYQLLECGLADANIELLDECTICRSDIFHSYRRDRERSGRMAGVIGILP
jgi:YfiH family protein